MAAAALNFSLSFVLGLCRLSAAAPVQAVAVFKETNGSGSRTPTLLTLDSKGGLLALANAVPSSPSAETRSHPVTGTWISTSTDAKSWSPQKLIPIPEGYGGTQALVDSSTGHVFLFLSADPALKQHCPVCHRYFIKSTDRGQSWDAAVTSMTSNTTIGGGLAHGITLRSGRLILGFRSDCRDGCPGCCQAAHDRSVFSDDQGPYSVRHPPHVATC
jgi:hypothetical protein